MVKVSLLIVTLLPLLCFSQSDQGVSLWEEQYYDLRNQLGNQKTLAKSASSTPVIPPSEVLDQQSMVLPTDKTPLDVQIRRSEALLNHLQSMKNAPNLSALESSLKKTQTEREELGQSQRDRGL